MIRRLAETVRKDLQPYTTRGRLIRSAGSTAGIRVASLVIAFLASILYARLLGPGGYGAFAVVIAWVGLLEIPASLGLPQYLLRETGTSADAVRRNRRWADRAVVVAAVMIATVLIIRPGELTWLFVAAAPLLVLGNLGENRRVLLQACGRPATSQFAKKLLAPGALLMALIVIWFATGRLTALDLVLATVAMALIPIVFNQIFLSRRTCTAPPETEEDERTLSIRGALPFVFLGVTTFINTRIDLIMVGAVAGNEAAGVYAVVARIGMLVPFVLVVSNLVIARHMAKLYRAGDRPMLQRLLKASTRRVFIATAPFAIVIIVASGPLLTFLYGQSFASGTMALSILTAGQLMGVFAGPNGLALNMTGSEQVAARLVLYSAILNAVLNALLVPFFGIEGAALATAVAIMVLNGTRWRHLKKNQKIATSVLG